MSAFRQSTGALVWEPLLTPAEIKVWFQTRRRPQALRRIKGVSHPIVYRAIFRKFEDENGSHVPCYIGEGGDFRRLSNHFRPDPSRMSRANRKLSELPGGWWIRGAIQNSAGDFRLEVLKIRGSINIFGVILSDQSFDDPFARRLLKNWAILYARDVEKLHPYNRGVSQSGKDLRRKLSASGGRNKNH